MASAVTNSAMTLQVDTEIVQSSPQPWWKLSAYGSMALPLSLSEIPILLYLPAFYSQEFGLSAALVGTVFFCARLWDGLFDVLVGWLSDRSGSRFGRRKPWVVVGAPFLMISTWFLCNPPEDSGLVYLAVWAALFYTADALVKIPHLSWGAELATDYVERSRVTGFRGVFSMLGTVFFVTAPLVFLREGAPLSEVLSLVAITVLVLTPFASLILGWFVPDPPGKQVRAHRAGPAEVLKILASLAKDRVMVNFCVAMLLNFTVSGIVNSLAVFSFGVGLGLSGKLSWIIFLLYISALCTMPLLMRLSKNVEKHRMLVCVGGIVAAIYVCSLFIPTGNFPIAAALWIAAGAGGAAQLFLPTSILADIIDRGELASGARISGSYMAIYNLTMKIGLALGVGLSFVLLDLVGYNPAVEHHTATDARNIRLLGFGLPALLCVPGLILMWRHKITRTVQQQMRVEIDARNNAG
jgi:glycoside/pentoside/hexuronide:cation symporter, GPH family